MPRDLAVFSIGTLPFLLILGAFVVVGAFLLLERLTASDITEILIAMGTIWMIVMVVLIFITQICMSISPTEGFVSGSDSDQELEDQQFFADLAKAESDVCALMAEVITFIKNDVGKPGQDDPSRNDQAIQTAMNKVDGPITVCPPASPPTTIEDANDRLARMEHTLAQFIEPELKHTYEVTFDKKGCDSFMDYTPRLQAIQDTIKSLTSQYLAPIQQKQKELRSGNVSDCDKKKAASSSVSVSVSAH